MSETNKDFDYYTSLPYRIVLLPSPEGGYAAEIPDLPGCISQGNTAQEAVDMVLDAKQAWIEIALEDNRFIPEPNSSDFSGKFNVRLPKSLHRELAEHAKREGVSLNQLVLHRLSSRNAQNVYISSHAAGPAMAHSLVREGKVTGAESTEQFLSEELESLVNELHHTAEKLSAFRKTIDETSVGHVRYNS